MTTLKTFAGVNVERNCPCTMRDGIVLYADIYRPKSEHKLPVLLMRQPYGRAIASTVSHAHPIWYARHGFIVVIQDVRGKWDSEGEFDPFVYEANDGYDTVEWAAQLPGSNGNVGMYGFSYQGSTQWAAAAAAPPHLKAIAPAMCASDLYHGMFYPFGRLLLKEHLPWAYQLARDNARRAGDEEAEQQCAMNMRNPEALYWKLPLSGKDQHPLLEQYFPQYLEWCEHEGYDDYWRERDWLSLLKKQAHLIPALHIGGWYDVFLNGSIQSFEELKYRPGGEQHRLIIGPWTHIPWGRFAGGYDHGDQADGYIHEQQLRWFNYWLKGEGEIPSIDKAIKYFEWGSNSWRELGLYEQLNNQQFHLSSTSKPANGSLGGGVLSTSLVTDSTKSEASVDVFVYDSRQPIRVNTFEPLARQADQDRYEILNYTSEPLTKDLHFYGTPIVNVYSQVLTGSADIVAILSVVLRDGTARQLSIGRSEVVESDDPTLTMIKLKACAACVSAGSRVRLEVTGSAFPLFPRYPNHLEATPNTAQPFQLDIATVAIYSDVDNQHSYLQLQTID